MQNILNRNDIMPAPVRNGFIGWRKLMNHYKDQQLVWQFAETDSHFLCLIQDNDSNYTAAFDTIFKSQQINVIPAPIKAPNANAYAERWIRTVRQEVLDHLLVINEGHLRRMLNEYIAYDNARRPHQVLEQQSPLPRVEQESSGKIEQRQILSSIINDYFIIPQETAVCPA